MDTRKRVRNPYTGRMIIVGGKTYRKVFSNRQDQSQSLGQSQRGGGVFDDLLNKAQSMNSKPSTKRDPNAKFHQVPSKLPPAPDSTDHSWYHHHAPFAQTFGDYVCLKKSTLRELGSFLKNVG